MNFLRLVAIGILSLSVLIFPSPRAQADNTDVSAGTICLLDGGMQENTADDRVPGMVDCAKSPACGSPSVNAAQGRFGVRLNKGTAETPIDAHGKCRYLENTSDNDYFVPFKSEPEWSAFLSNPPPGVTRNINAATNMSTHCAKPFIDNQDSGQKLHFGDAATRTVRFDLGDSGDAVTANVTLPYWRTGKTWPPAGTCSYTKTFNNSCYHEYPQPYCWDWVNQQCNGSECIAFNSSGTCSSTRAYTYDCSYCRDPGTVCARQDHPWSETFDFVATAGDSDIESPSWKSGVSTKTSADSRPAICLTRCITGPRSCTGCTGERINGACGTAQGLVTSVAPGAGTLCSTGYHSGFTTTLPWRWFCYGYNGGTTASCNTINPIANGACGWANGQTLSSAPSGGSLCTTGTASGVSGSGPWSWTCGGRFGGANANCSAQRTAPTCPPVSVYGAPSMLGPLANPLGAGWMNIRVAGFSDGRANATQLTNNGGQMQWTGWGNQGCNYYDSWSRDVLVQCIVTGYVRSLPGYDNMQGSCTVNGGYISPLKVNLVGKDAAMNKTRPTSFYLTVSDERVMKGNVIGGLNPDEGWLMVHRDGGPLVYKDGSLNADNWFGDRDGRTANGYTDLAETFKDFVLTDEQGGKFIPLRVLSKEEKLAKIEEQRKSKSIAITDPSFDLRILDAKNEEHLASDFFSRIYVDYLMVSEGDGPKGEAMKNVILERGIVVTLTGENHTAVDQWFILDLPPGLGPVNHPTQSKMLPKGSKPKR